MAKAQAIPGLGSGGSQVISKSSKANAWPPYALQLNKKTTYVSGFKGISRL
jgi:hypothetical protein